MNDNALLDTARFMPKALNSPNAWVGHLPFAAHIIRELSPAVFVELGTHTGNSYFSFCQAVLESGLPTKCFAVDTWKGDEHAGHYTDEIYSKVSAYNQERYADFSHLLRMTFDEAQGEFSEQSIGLLHIDGLHTYEAVRHDFETWLPKLSPGAVVLFHDTQVRDRDFGVWQFWQELQQRYPNNLEFKHSHGLGVLQLNSPPAGKTLDWLTPGCSERDWLIRYFEALGSSQLTRFQIDELARRQAEQAIAERDSEIIRLNQILAEAEKQIAVFNVRFKWLKLLLSLARRAVYAALHPLSAYRLERDIRIIKHSGLFDSGYYMSTYRDIKMGAYEAVRHYCELGWQEGRNPSASFSTTAYLERNEDVRVGGVNPLVHYILFGRHEKRLALKPDPMFPSAVLPQNHVDECFSPKVSVIVPNYNHAKFLNKRLDSIYQQSYKNIEVILLDDASTDGSDELLKEYYRKYPSITRYSFNQQNSGGVFRQWRRGLDLAQGELIWIAESDDFCSPNFLAELVGQFSNEAIMLAFCRSVFIKGEDEKQVWTTEEYLCDLYPELWRGAFVMSAHKLVNMAWAVKNIIPNASSAVFRHPGRMELLDDAEWLGMRICGDWIFYLQLVRGGYVAYTINATNYYRFHAENTSTATYSQDVYYKEHALVAEKLQYMFCLRDGILERQKKELQSQWNMYAEEHSGRSFNQFYDLTQIRAASQRRKPNLMMACYHMRIGGGEIFPLKLANLLKSIGYSITVVNFRQQPTQSGVRNILRPDIPLVKISNIVDLVTVAREMGIEIIHSHHAWVDKVLCELFKDVPSIQIVVTTHGMYEMMDRNDLAGISDLLREKVSKFIYVADKNIAKFDIGFFGQQRFIKIDNALDIVPINPIHRVDLGIPEDSFVVCLVSRAIREKGWEEACKAIQLAQAMTPRPIHLLLIGDGSECGRLKPLMNCGNIHFLGFKDNVRDYFSASDIGLLPSRFKGESAPLALIECLLAGRPMIASNVGEISSMLSTENGGMAGRIFDLVEGEIPLEELARIIAEYANNHDVYLDHLDKVRFAVLKFNPDVMLKKYDCVYQEICFGNT